MSQLSNTPRDHTVLTLEARKSFSFGMKFRTESRGAVDLGGASLNLVVGEPAHLGGSKLFTVEATFPDAYLGLAQFSIQAEDLDLEEAEYPFAVVLVSQLGYSTVVLKGCIDLRANVDDASVLDQYPDDINPSSNFLATLDGPKVVNVRVDSLDGMGVLVQELVDDFRVSTQNILDAGETALGEQHEQFRTVLEHDIDLFADSMAAELLLAREAENAAKNHKDDAWASRNEAELFAAKAKKIAGLQDFEDVVEDWAIVRLDTDGTPYVVTDNLGPSSPLALDVDDVPYLTLEV